MTFMKIPVQPGADSHGKAAKRLKESELPTDDSNLWKLRLHLSHCMLQEDHQFPSPCTIRSSEFQRLSFVLSYRRSLDPKREKKTLLQQEQPAIFSKV